MPTFSAESTLACTPERFWSLYLDDAWVLAMFRDGLAFESATLVSVERSPSFRRSIRATPRVELPAPVKAALGGRLNYTEHGTFDGRLFRWQVVVDAMPERIRLDGTIEVIAEGAGCKRKDQATIQVDLFGVRGAVERVFEASTRDNWSKAATYTQRWLATHP
jgi:hypothetical protein